MRVERIYKFNLCKKKNNLEEDEAAADEEEIQTWDRIKEFHL